MVKTSQQNKICKKEVILEFKVTAKRYGDSVKFFVQSDTTKGALLDAKREANSIFDFKPGDAGAPSVSMEPVPEPDDKGTK